jgi:hypothetical protein
MSSSGSSRVEAGGRITEESNPLSQLYEGWHCCGLSCRPPSASLFFLRLFSAAQHVHSSFPSFITHFSFLLLHLRQEGFTPGFVRLGLWGLGAPIMIPPQLCTHSSPGCTSFGSFLGLARFGAWPFRLLLPAAHAMDPPLAALWAFGLAAFFMGAAFFVLFGFVVGLRAAAAAPRLGPFNLPLGPFNLPLPEGGAKPKHSISG